MSEQFPYEPKDDQPKDEPGQAPPEPADWREARRRERQQWREERRAARREWRGAGGTWIAGAVLILAGGLLLLQNFGLFQSANWWALFILIPAGGALFAAWEQMQAAGGVLTRPARGSLLGGLGLTLVALVLFFGVDWAILWPLLLIVFGVGLLLNAVLPG